MTTSFDIIFENHDKLRESLTQLRKSHEKNKRISVEIPAQEVMTRDFLLDASLSDDDIIRFLKSRAVEWFGYDSEQLCLDYKKQIQNKEKQTITVIAAHRSLINSICESFSEMNMPIYLIYAATSDKTINLLPWREIRQKKRQKKAILYWISCIVSIFCILISVKYFLLLETKKLALKTQLINKTSDQIVLHHPHQKAALLQQIKTLRAEKSAAIKHNQSIETALADIANAMPNNTTLKSLTLNQKKIKINGESSQLAEIHQYSNALKQQFTGKNVQLSEMHHDQNNKTQMNFMIRVTP